VSTTSPCLSSSPATTRLVVERLYRALRSRMLRLCGHEDGEDVVQETLARLIAHGVVAAHAGDPDTLRKVAFGYARRVVFELYRRRMRSPTCGEGVELAISVPFEAVFALKTAFAKLSRADQQLLWAVDVEGIEQLEIARIVGIPAGTVRARVTRARGRLAAWVEFGMPVAPLPTPVGP